jgi:peptide/nickel transport system substrate-binding protein
LLFLVAFVLTACKPAVTPPPAEDAPAQPEATEAPAAATEAPAAATEAPAAEAPAATEAPAAAEPAAEMKRLVVVIGEEPPNLDPGEGTIIALNTYRNVYETLLSHDPSGALVPELATAWEQANDTTWRFHLREGVKFHDGEPFNAEAAAWMINYLFNPDNNKHILGNLPAGTVATAVDEYTLDIATPDPFPALPAAMFFANMASPKAIQGDTEGAFRTMVGTGPYKFKEWVAGEKLILEKNPDYWGGDVSAIQEVEITWRAESAVRSAMAETGEAHISVALDPTDTATGNVVAIPISETPFIRMDLPNPPLNDLRIRQAICLLIDRQNIADKLYGGFAIPATQLIGPNVVGYNGDIPLIPYDPAAAKALIEQARADGVAVDNKITVYLRSTSDGVTLQMMLAILAAASEAGLNLNLELNEPAKHTAIARALPVPADRLAIFWGQHGNEMQDASFTIQAYYMPGGIHSTLLDETGQKFVDLYKAASVLSGAERQTALADVMKYQADNVVATCPIVHIQYIYKLGDGVQFQPRSDHLILAKEVTLP